MSGSEVTYFIRRRGRTLGPFELRQLERMQRRGQVGQIDEFSTDCRNWRKLRELEELYPPEKKDATNDNSVPEHDNNEGPDNEISVSHPPSVPAEAEVEWNYCISGEKKGPVSETTLQAMIAQGQVRDGDLVWKEGFVDWKPAIEFFAFPSVLLSTVRQQTIPQSGFDPSVQGHINAEIISRPHRGGMIVAFGLIGVLIFAPLALAAWVMGAGDLSKMQAGTMDTSGLGATKTGMVLGIIGTIFWGIVVIFTVSQG